MVFHFRKFFVGQLIRFFQNIIVDCHFADIMKCASQIHFFLNLCGIVAVYAANAAAFSATPMECLLVKEDFIVDDLRKKSRQYFAGFPVKGLFFSNDLPEFRFKASHP